MGVLDKEGISSLLSPKECPIDVASHNQETGSIILTKSDGMIFYHYQASSELVDNISDHSVFVILGKIFPIFINSV